jgi:hypothetical protein
LPAPLAGQPGAVGRLFGLAPGGFPLRADPTQSKSKAQA